MNCGLCSVPLKLTDEERHALLTLHHAATEVQAARARLRAAGANFCLTCDEVLPVSAFRTRGDWIENKCRTCHSEGKHRPPIKSVLDLDYHPEDTADFRASRKRCEERNAYIAEIFTGRGDPDESSPLLDDDAFDDYLS